MSSHRLPARLVLGTARALRDELLRLPAGEAVALDAGEVVAVDAAGLQVLLAAARTSRARGGERVLVRPSPAMRRILELTGLSERLEPRGPGGAP